MVSITATPTLRHESRREAHTSHEPDVIVRARLGNADALTELFDAVVFDVYGLALRRSGRVKTAERVTEAVVGEVREALRQREWRSVADFREHLLRRTRTEIGRHARSLQGQAPSMHTLLRRIFLLAAMTFATAYAGSFIAF